MKKIMNFLFFFVGSGMIFVSILFLLSYGADKEMKVRCYSYQQQSEDFPDFWIMASEKVECDRLGVYVNAKVR